MRPMPSSAAVRVRPFRLDDAERVEPWLQAPGLSLPGGSARATWPVRLLADGRIVARVAESGGACLGFFRLDCGPDRMAEITLVVAPEWRRRGLGQRILAAALRTAQQVGVGVVVALVDAANPAALAFFAAAGFADEGMVGGRHRLVRWLHGRAGLPLDIEV